MSAYPPPLPPAQKPKHGGGDDGRADVTGGPMSGSVGSNPEQQGQTANTKQNTTNEGLQQGR